jgi:hypothetical protein
MKRLIVVLGSVAALALAGAGCTELKACESNADCAGSGVCEPSMKICYVPEDAGGEKRDGGADSGVDAGPAVLCAEGCAAWQTCKPTSISNGVCVNATIVAQRPADNAKYGEDNAVTFVFEVTQWDGGMWPGDVPFSVGEGMIGPTKLTRMDTTFEAQVSLAKKAGPQTVVAGWEAVDAGKTVVVEACSVSCQVYEKCVPNDAGGACVEMGLTLAFTAPTVSDEYGPVNSGQVAMVLTATRADGEPFLAPIPFKLSKDGTTLVEGELTKTGPASWTGSVDAGVEDGARALFAGWDGGPHATGAFNVTATPPTITLVPESAPVRPANQTDTDGTHRWKKSEVAAVRLVSNRDLLTAPTSADFNNGSAVSSPATCAEACVAPRCYCFAVDLAQLPFTQTAPGTLYGTVPVSLNKSLTDKFGNNGAAAPVAIHVTRFKWRQVVASHAAASPTALAITPSGVVIAGASVGATSTLTALEPDGGVAWQKAYGSEAITAGPMAGETGIYFAVNSGGAGVLRKLALDGSGGTDRCSIGGLAYSGDLALAMPGANEYPMAVANNATLMGGTKVEGTDCHASSVFWTTLDTGDRPTVVVEEGRSYVALSSQPPIWRFDTLGATPASQGSRSTITLFPSNLFSVGTNIVGGGGGGPTVGGVFSFFDDGAALDGGATTNATPGESPGGAAAVGPPAAGDSRLRVYYGDSGGSFRQVRVSADNPPIFGSASSTAATGLNLSKRAPIVGAGGHLYSAASGRVYVYDSSPAQEWYWDVPNAPTETVGAQINLDKNRDAADPCGSGQPGVLYVVTSTGAQTSVYAILVDSKGVEATAPWPRFQHNPGNTGNRATGLADWTCE